MSQNSEQWLSDGVCRDCRRKTYCSKPCTANKRRMKLQVFRAMDAATGGMMHHLIKKTKESMNL